MMAICKGDWNLGTACGKCDKCINTAAPYIAELKEALRQMRDAAVYVSASRSSEGLREDADRKLSAAIGVARALI